MAVKFRNRLTGSIMWVTDDRVEEYKNLGHIMVGETISEKPSKKTVTEKAETFRKGSRKKEMRWM